MECRVDINWLGDVYSACANPPKMTSDITKKHAVAFARAVNQNSIISLNYMRQQVDRNGFMMMPTYASNMNRIKKPDTAIPTSVSDPIPFVPAHVFIVGIAHALEKKGANPPVLFNALRSITDGIALREPWHNHPDHHYTMFYCHQSHESAQTRIFHLGNTTESELKVLKKKQKYNPESTPFGLVQSDKNGDYISPQMTKLTQTYISATDYDVPDVYAWLTQKIEHKDSIDSEPLELFKSLLDDAKGGYALEKGQYVIVNERTTLRSMDSFSVQNGEQSRWLIGTTFG